MSQFIPNQSCGPCLYCAANAENGPEEMVRCDLCRRSAHIPCLKTGPPPGMLLADNFFNFTCAHCHHSERDSVCRARLTTPQVLVLVLYNLHMTDNLKSRNGYFHWKINIYNFINQNWKEIFGPESRKKKKKVFQASVSGQLSHYPQYFESGYETLRDGGWYRLASILPPAQVFLQQLKSNDPASKKRKREDAISASSLDSIFKIKEESTISESKESLSSGDISFESPDESSRGSWFTERDLLKPEACPPQNMFDDSEEDAPSGSNLGSVMNEDSLVMKETIIEVDDIDVGAVVDVGAFESPGGCTTPVMKPSLFTLSKQTKKIDFPKRETEQNLPLMSVYEEKELLQKLKKLQSSKALPPHLYRLYRKLSLRQQKREHGLPLLDVDAELAFHKIHGRLMTRREKLEQKQQNEGSSESGIRVLDRFQVSNLNIGQKDSAFNGSFLTKLVGNSGNGSHQFIHSPYTLRDLKPFILRDYESEPLRLRLHQEIVAYPHRNDSLWKPPPKHPIDFCYVTHKHIPAMNQLARHFFWPGIDLAEVLQYPDHTCVVLYCHLVIGFGVLVPDTGFNEAYLSFVLVHPDWRRAGIAKMILYHLIQSCQGKDVTLHVSATNPALILYQQFGFKVEEFLSNFYDKYLPEDSPDCRHAMYLRLSR